MSRRFFSAVIGASISLLSSSAFAAITANHVVSYSAGSNLSAGFQMPEAALGGLNPTPGPEFGPAALSPFNPPFHNTDIVVIGGGGQLTLQFASPIALTAQGPQIGVFVNNGLIDTDFPHGVATNPAVFFSAIPRAIVRVSQNGMDFFQIGSDQISFDVPTNFWADLPSDPSNSLVDGTVPADIGKPFTGHLSDFNGLNWPQMLALLDGSAGGTWLDFRGTPLSQVNFIQFEVPPDANPNMPMNRMVIDVVSAVPEPGVLLGLIAIVPIFTRRKRS